MQGVSEHGVFCDWLSLSMDVNNSFMSEMISFLEDEGYRSEDGTKYSRPHGSTIKIITDGSRWENISFSGGAMEYFRTNNLVHQLISLMVPFPYRVTRLDLARDSVHEHPDLYLDNRYKLGIAGTVSLSRKRIDPEKVSWAYKGPRECDGLETGTVYFGDTRRDRRSARVYDKRAQLMARGKPDIGINLIRTEVVCRRGAESLRDVLDPDELFYSLAAPDLAAKPHGVRDWAPVDLGPLDLAPRVERTVWQRYTRLIDNSVDLEAAVRLLSDESEATQAMALSYLQKHISYLLNTPPPASEDLSAPPPVLN